MSKAEDREIGLLHFDGKRFHPEKAHAENAGKHAGRILLDLFYIDIILVKSLSFNNSRKNNANFVCKFFRIC